MRTQASSKRQDRDAIRRASSRDGVARPALPLAGLGADAAIAIGLFCLTLAVFWPATAAAILKYDDIVYLDPATGAVRLTVPKEHAAFEGWHPLSWASLRLDDRLFGPGRSATTWGMFCCMRGVRPPCS